MNSTYRRESEMMIEYNEGDRVRIVAEGTVSSGYNKNSISTFIRIDTEHGSLYVEAYDALGPFVEKLKKPIKNGLYYSPSYGPGQMTGVFKHEDGKWYDSNLDKVTSDIPEDLVPLVLGER